MAHPLVMDDLGRIEVSPLDTHTSSTQQNHRTGTRGFLADGRVFYYTMNGTTTALTIGGSARRDASASTGTTVTCTSWPPR